MTDNLSIVCSQNRAHEIFRDSFANRCFFGRCTDAPKSLQVKKCEIGWRSYRCSQHGVYCGITDLNTRSNEVVCMDTTGEEEKEPPKKPEPRYYHNGTHWLLIKTTSTTTTTTTTTPFFFMTTPTLVPPQYQQLIQHQYHPPPHHHQHLNHQKEIPVSITRTVNTRRLQPSLANVPPISLDKTVNSNRELTIDKTSTIRPKPRVELSIEKATTTKAPITKARPTTTTTRVPTTTTPFYRIRWYETTLPPRQFLELIPKTTTRQVERMELIHRPFTAQTTLSLQRFQKLNGNCRGIAIGSAPLDVTLEDCAHACLHRRECAGFSYYIERRGQTAPCILKATGCPDPEPAVFTFFRRLS